MPERHSPPSDLSDAEWDILDPLMPPQSTMGRPRDYTRRELMNGIFYVLRSGCLWRMTPHDLPPWRSAYNAFREWRINSTWKQIHDRLRGDVRESVGKEREPSAAIIDSQSAKTTGKGALAAGMGPRKSRDASVISSSIRWD
jgi:putative transposase